jgi:hypothetical protein
LRLSGFHPVNGLPGYGWMISDALPAKDNTGLGKAGICGSYANDGDYAHPWGEYRIKQHICLAIPAIYARGEDHDNHS